MWKSEAYKWLTKPLLILKNLQFYRTLLKTKCFVVREKDLTEKEVGEEIGKNFWSLIIFN